MSYSFTIKAKTKADAIARATQEFNNTATSQPEAHGLDIPLERDKAMKLIDAMPEPKTGQVLNVSAYGSSARDWTGGVAGEFVSIENNLVVRLQPEEVAQHPVAHHPA